MRFFPRVLAIGISLCAWMAHGQTGNELAFDAASIKPASAAPDTTGQRFRYAPNGITASAVPVLALIMNAYQLPQELISGTPGWVQEDLFDVNAKSEQATGKSDIRRMLQTLLAERCHLTVHRETKQMNLYDLTVKDESKLYKLKEGAKPTDEEVKAVAGRTNSHDLSRMKEAGGTGGFGFTGTMDDLALSLSRNPEISRPVINKTGLEGTFMFLVQYYRGEFISELESVFGLKLQPRKGATELLVIDHIERPSAN